SDRVVLARSERGEAERAGPEVDQPPRGRRSIARELEPAGALEDVAQTVGGRPVQAGDLGQLADRERAIGRGELLQEQETLLQARASVSGATAGPGTDGWRGFRAAGAAGPSHGASTS